MSYLARLISAPEPANAAPRVPPKLPKDRPADDPGLLVLLAAPEAPALAASGGQATGFDPQLWSLLSQLDAAERVDLARLITPTPADQFAASLGFFPFPSGGGEGLGSCGPAPDSPDTHAAPQAAEGADQPSAEAPPARKFAPILLGPGSRASLCRRIARLLPGHRVYCEPIARDAAILLNKPSSEVEILSFDVKAEAELFRVLCDPLSSPDFVHQVGRLEFSQAVFDRGGLRWGRPICGDQRALALLVRNRMGRGGLGREFHLLGRLRRGTPVEALAWNHFKARLPAVAARLSGVRVRHQSAASTIREFDGHDTLFLCDPPPLPAPKAGRRTQRDLDREAEHRVLLENLIHCLGRVVLIGEPSAMNDSMLEGWARTQFRVFEYDGTVASLRRRTVCIWVKP